MKHILIILNILLFTSLSFSQEELRSDFYFVLSKQHYGQFLEQSFSKQISHKFANMSLKKPFKTSIEGIRANLSYNYKIKTTDQSDLFILDIEVNDLFFRVDKIETHDFIRQQVGPLYINVPIHGVCNKLLLKPLTDKIEAKSRLHIKNVNGRLQFDLSQLNIDLDTNWQLQAESCDGPLDYQASLKKEIYKVLQNKSQIESLLTGELQAQINQQVTQITEDILLPQQIESLEGHLISFNPIAMALSDQTGHLMIHGEVTSQSHQSTKSTLRDIAFQMSTKQLSGVEQSGLFVSQYFILALTQQMHEAGQLNFSLKAQDFEGIRQLLKSRFGQMFVFPDLINFSKKADFRFKVSFPNGPQLAFAGGDKGSLWFDYNARPEISMMAPVKGQHIPYVHFDYRVSGKGWFMVHNKELHFGLYRPSNTKLKYQWDEDYLKKYEWRTSNKYINRNKLRKEIKKAMTDYRDTVELPTFDFGNLGILEPSSLKQEGNWIQLIYQPAP